MSNYNYLKEFEAAHGAQAAYREALRIVGEQDRHLEIVSKSRFHELRTEDDGSIRLVTVHEDQVSHAHDHADFNNGEVPKFVYCDTAGNLHPISIGEKMRNSGDPDEPDAVPFNYATSAMIANSVTVGYVHWTNH